MLVSAITVIALLDHSTELITEATSTEDAGRDWAHPSTLSDVVGGFAFTIEAAESSILCLEVDDTAIEVVHEVKDLLVGGSQIENPLLMLADYRVRVSNTVFYI
jgi:hypothetical protein